MVDIAFDVFFLCVYDASDEFPGVPSVSLKYPYSDVLLVDVEGRSVRGEFYSDWSPLLEEKLSASGTTGELFMQPTKFSTKPAMRVIAILGMIIFLSAFILKLLCLFRLFMNNCYSLIVNS